jgi:hypothetical protein
MATPTATTSSSPVAPNTNRALSRLRILCHEHRRSTRAVRNCRRDEGRPFEFGNQVLISSHRKLLSSKAMVVNVAEKSGQRF